MDYEEDDRRVPLCPLCGAALDADCQRVPCDWLADTGFPSDRLNENGNVIPAYT